MKKNILILGIISLFIGMAIIPLCSASTSSTVISTCMNDPPPLRTFFIKAEIEGTASGLQKGIFRVVGHGPIDLTVNALSGTYDQYFYGSSWTFSAILTKLDTFDPEHNYIKGTVYFLRFYLSD